jgi:hypothetical protein
MLGISYKKADMAPKDDSACEKERESSGVDGLGCILLQQTYGAIFDEST